MIINILKQAILSLAKSLYFIIYSSYLQFECIEDLATAASKSREGNVQSRATTIFNIKILGKLS